MGVFQDLEFSIYEMHVIPQLDGLDLESRVDGYRAWSPKADLSRLMPSSASQRLMTGTTHLSALWPAPLRSRVQQTILLAGTLSGSLGAF